MDSSDSPATTANTHKSLVAQGVSSGVPTTRRMSATPLPVSIALAGHTNARLSLNVSTTSITAQVRIAARIWGTLTRKWSPTCPRTWIVMMTAATWRRGSRIVGRTRG